MIAQINKKSTFTYLPKTPPKWFDQHFAAMFFEKATIIANNKKIEKNTFFLFTAVQFYVIISANNILMAI